MARITIQTNRHLVGLLRQDACLRYPCRSPPRRGKNSDAAIETADVVIENDQPARIATAIRIGHQTNRIVWQNIGLAFAVKATVLILGAGGLATMWEAVFADVGMALLAILNAVRIQRMRF